MWLEVLPHFYPAHGFGVQIPGEAKCKRPWIGRVEMESMQAGSQITFIESLLCARHWGAWGRRVGTSPCLLGEDLLVAHTDLEYVTTQSCQESHR